MDLRPRALVARFADPRALRALALAALLVMAWAAPAPGSTSFASFQAWLGTSNVFLDGFESESTCPWSTVQPPDPVTCANGTEDGCETDIDCGGRSCGGCANFKHCLVGADCLSGMCSNGICAECLAPDTCPGDETECQFRTCTGLACGLGCNPAGTITSGQITGDCQVSICDGFCKTISVPDDSDLPDDGNQCTTDLCAGGVPTHGFEPPGTVCAQNGGSMCDGNGNCV